MTGRQVAVLLSPAVVVLVAAIPAGLVGGPKQVIPAGIAIALTVPAAFSTFWLTRWMSAHHPLGGVIGMLVGVVLRIGVAFGGGAAVFLLSPGFQEMALSYWLWLLFAYLATLLTETALLVKLSPLVASGAAGAKG